MSKPTFRVATFINQKGGAGKTASAGAVGANLARRGHKVLLIDFDPQGNLSANNGISKNPETEIMMQILGAKPFQPYELRKDLYIVPTSFNLSSLELQVDEFLDDDADKNAKYLLLKTFIDNYASSFDFIIIDAPPSLDIRGINVLNACDTVFIPLEAEINNVSGLEKVLESVSKVRKAKLNPNLNIGGVFFTRHDSRPKIVQKIVEDISKIMPGAMMNTYIRTQVAIREAAFMKQNLYDYIEENEQHSNAADDYDDLVSEMLNEKPKSKTSPNLDDLAKDFLDYLNS